MQCRVTQVILCGKLMPFVLKVSCIYEENQKRLYREREWQMEVSIFLLLNNTLWLLVYCLCFLVSNLAGGAQLMLLWL